LITSFNQPDVNFSNLYNLNTQIAIIPTIGSEITNAVNVLNNYDGNSASLTASINNPGTIAFGGIQTAINGLNSIVGSNGIVALLKTQMQTITT